MNLFLLPCPHSIPASQQIGHYEAAAAHVDEILGTDAAIDLLGKKKTLKEKILSFFKGAEGDGGFSAKFVG